MPAINRDSTSLFQGGRRRKFSPSAALQRLPKANLRNLLLGLILFFVIRTFFFARSSHKEVIDHIDANKETGESGLGHLEEVIGKTAAERKKYVDEHHHDPVQLKRDITSLLNEVHNLRAVAQKKLDADGATDPHADRQMGLQEMDHLHLMKRKAREEKLLRDHPDFVPSRRINRDGEAAAAAAAKE